VQHLHFRCLLPRSAPSVQLCDGLLLAFAVYSSIRKMMLEAQFEQGLVKHFSAQHVLQLTGTLHETWFDKHEAQHA